MDKANLNFGPMLNAYPDSLGGALKDAAALLKRPELAGAFSSFYILPSLYNTDLDRGFSVIDYRLNELLASEEDLRELSALGIDLKLDMILNHASVLSPQFQDLLKNGSASPYRDFFIDWNRFWEGCGEMTPEGYIQPRPELIENMFFRKPGLPILMVRFPDGGKVPYWNTFYQEVRYPEAAPQDFMGLTGGRFGAAQRLADAVNQPAAQGRSPEEGDFSGVERYREAALELMEARRLYLGQMDVNIKSPLVWDFYKDTLDRLAAYGAKIVRLDAFAYAPKEAGSRNFLNDPGTWELLERVTGLARPHGISLLPEIHASYEEGTYRTISRKGYMVYDFFLPGLVLDAFEQRSGEALARWANEITGSGMLTVNMLGCHDGIPLLDLKGLLPEERIQGLIQALVARGGYVKDLHGAKNVYYQVNATYYSALGEDDRRMLLARALQLFMPGKPQVWYLDLFAGRNDYAAMERAEAGGHKEINRTNLTPQAIEEGLRKPVVQKQLELLKLRAGFPVFSPEAAVSVTAQGSGMRFLWSHAGQEAELAADLSTLEFTATVRDAGGRTLAGIEQK